MIWPNFTMSPPSAIAARAILWPAATGADSGTPSPSGREPSGARAVRIATLSAGWRTSGSRVSSMWSVFPGGAAGRAVASIDLRRAASSAACVAGAGPALALTIR